MISNPIHRIVLQYISSFGASATFFLLSKYKRALLATAFSLYKSHLEYLPVKAKHDWTLYLDRRLPGAPFLSCPSFPLIIFWLVCFNVASVLTRGVLRFDTFFMYFYRPEMLTRLDTDQLQRKTPEWHAPLTTSVFVLAWPPVCCLSS